MDYKELRENIAKNFYSKYAQDLSELAKMASKNDIINPKLYEKYDVKRGLRDVNGNGVVCGLTEISEIQAFKKDKDGTKHPTEGQLYYRGIEIRELVKGVSGRRFAFEEAAFLLLFGSLPTQHQLQRFCELLADFRFLPVAFVRDIIMKAPSRDMMNMLARCVLSLYSYDPRPDDTSKRNVLRQSLQLIAQFPVLSVYSYQVFKYYHDGGSLIIHKPRQELSTAEAMLALGMKGKRVLLPRAKEARDVLPEALRAAGAEVDVVAAYENVPSDENREEVLAALKEGRLDCVTFGSSSTVRNFLSSIPLEILKKHPEIRFAAIGPVTAKTMREMGLEPDIQPESFTIPALADAVCTAFARQGAEA